MQVVEAAALIMPVQQELVGLAEVATEITLVLVGMPVQTVLAAVAAAVGEILQGVPIPQVERVDLVL
jgi:hypothetical protein